MFFWKGSAIRVGELKVCLRMKELFLRWGEGFYVVFEKDCSRVFIDRGIMGILYVKEEESEMLDVELESFSFFFFRVSGFGFIFRVGV